MSAKTTFAPRKMVTARGSWYPPCTSLSRNLERRARSPGPSACPTRAAMRCHREASSGSKRRIVESRKPLASDDGPAPQEQVRRPEGGAPHDDERYGRDHPGVHVTP